MKPHLVIMGIDCSFTCTGLAVGTKSSLIGLEGLVFKVAKNQNPARRFAEFNELLQRRIETWGPSIICVERPHMQGFAATACGMGLFTRVQELAYRNDVDCHDIRADHLKIFATGKGNATKELMKIAASEQFPEYNPDDDKGGDLADALMLMAWGREGCPLPEKKLKKAPSQGSKSSVKSHKAKTRSAFWTP